ncbi:hypothetical protein JCM5296_005294, partial [Sporobolomyces johnsonii]
MTTSSSDEARPTAATRLPHLTTGNFSNWLRRLNIYVSANGRSAILRGDPLSDREVLETIAEYNVRIAKREEDESWVLNLVYTTIDESNAAFIESAATAKDAVELLQAHHGATRVHTVSKLLADLLDTKLASGGDVHAHMTRMR